VKKRIFVMLSIAAIAAAATACSFSTANMSSLKSFKDKDNKTAASSYKAGETIYATAEISNSMDKVTVKYSLNDEKGVAQPGSEIKVDLPSSGSAKYTLPIPEGFKGGKFKLTADMLNEKGEKKDSKSIDITIEAGAPPAAAPAAPASDDKDAADDKDHKDSKDDH